MVTFWACMTSIFHARQFFINSEHILDILRPKKWALSFCFDFVITFLCPQCLASINSERCAPIPALCALYFDQSKRRCPLSTGFLYMNITCRLKDRGKLCERREAWPHLFNRGTATDDNVWIGDPRDQRLLLWSCTCTCRLTTTGSCRTETSKTWFYKLPAARFSQKNNLFLSKVLKIIQKPF